MLMATLLRYIACSTQPGSRRAAWRPTNVCSKATITRESKKAAGYERNYGTASRVPWKYWGQPWSNTPENEPLRNALGTRLDQVAYYRQLLSFVYRMLFLMVTEERRFLFTSTDIQRQRIYDRYYSISNLRNRAEQYSAGDRHSDLWVGLAETFRIFRNEESAQALGLSPLNGELFGSDACKDIEDASCTNEDFLRAMRALSTFNDDGIRRRVNYAHLDVEEFGSVYESLLDYRPVVDLGQISSPQPSFQLASGTERKQTGSYYTPPELVRELVESALVPVMEERPGSRQNTRRIRSERCST